MRQLDAESVNKAVAQKRKAAPAKAAAKPAKANTNINKGDNATTSH